MEIYRLDRIEDGVASVESPEGEMLRFDAGLFPAGTKTGDCFTLSEGIFLPAEDETQIRRKKLSALLKGIIEKKNR